MMKKIMFAWGTLALAGFLLFLGPIFANASGCEPGQIDINSATVEELDQLSGVGPATANNIINARPYGSVDDLVNASGIGDKKLEDIKNQGLACVNSVDSSSGSEPDTSSGPSATSTPQENTDPEPEESEPAPNTEVSTASSGDVVISEIAWMGSFSSPNDEWIELYNTTSAPVDLTGWSLVSLDGTPKINISSSSSSKPVITPGNFFVLERTSDDASPGVQAGFIYTGTLSNTGESLVLSDGASNQIDMVDASSGWPAGDNSTKQTMQLAVSGSWVTADPTPGDTNNNPPPKPVVETKSSESVGEEDGFEELDEKEEEALSEPYLNLEPERKEISKPEPKKILARQELSVNSLANKEEDNSEDDDDILAGIALSENIEGERKKRSSNVFAIVLVVLSVINLGFLWVVRKQKNSSFKRGSFSK